MRALWDGLPVAGVNGTLIDQLADTPLAGKVRGKTGSLDGVSGLLGMVDLGRAGEFRLPRQWGLLRDQSGGAAGPRRHAHRRLPERPDRRRAGPETHPMSRRSLHRVPLRTTIPDRVRSADGF